MSQSELARRLGVHAGSINRYERGKVVPGLETAARLAEELSVSLDWLVTGEGQGPEGGSDLAATGS